MIKGLPYDAEVEYLESTGTQGINIAIDSISRYIVDFEPTQYIYLGSIISVIKISEDVFRGDKVGLIRMFNNQFQINLDGWYDSSVAITERHVADMNAAGGYFKIDSEEIVKNYSFGEKDYIILSRWNESSDLRNAKAKYYGLMVWSATGMLTHNLIPVRVGSGSSAVGYMYDRVSRKLYGNQGTGSFVIGPDVATPVMGLHFYPEANA